MRILAILAILLAASLAGCLNGDDDSGTGTTDDPTADPTVTPPEAQHYEGSLSGAGSADTGDGPECSVDETTTQEAQCAIYPLDLEERWKVTFTLESFNSPVTDVTQAATSPTDYDLYIYDSEGSLIAQSTNPGDQIDKVTKTFAAGSYDVLVEAWNDQGGSYTLDIEFAAP